MSFGIDLPSDQDWSQLLSSLDFDVGVEANGTTCEPEHDVRGQTRGHVGHAHAPTPPKVGTRFSTASLKILKAWLRDHEDHPYPSSKDISRLEAQTGLEKQQITNWYANVRRRTRARHVPRPTSPSLASVKPQRQPPGQEVGRSIPGKPGPSPFSDMDPMQRWQNSPPEYEPSAAADILAAVSASDYHDGHDAKRADAGYMDRATSDDVSSATSARRSNSSTGSSVGSAYSYASQTSRKSIDVLATQKPRRRKRKVATRRQADNRNGLLIATRTYQCTFCAETFATKHNWQRHEKSLHISLEGWECSPDGPTFVDADSNKATCVYCGLVDPDAAHVAGHDYGECERRAPEERIFYRKDHLQQHLTLVHGAAFQRTSMETWKRQNQLIRSRCGFCNLALESWDERVDHIAEHFKTGKSMADWEGGWGFEPHVADKIESAIPPYLIHYERYSPWPFTGYHEPSGTPSSAFELISVEMEYYSNEFMAAHQRRPTLAEMQYECCSRVLGAEQLTAAHNRQNNRPTTRADGNGNVGNTSSSASWLRDLVMSDESIAREARLRPLREAAKVSITPLRVNGKSTVFESCALEGALQQRVQASHAMGLAVMNQDIRVMACQVVAEMTAKAPWPSKSAQDFLIELIYTTCGTWFTKFRQRAGLPVDEACPLGLHGGAGNGWHDESVVGATLDAGGPEATWSLGSLTTVDDVSSYSPNFQSAHGAAGGLREHGLGDDSCYRRLMKELVRYTRSAMSPYNPNQHVPTDEELQHHARWIMFDDDDPWNQTPADNAEWLRHFKKDQGLDVNDPDPSVS